jgi:hypothetical protein
MGLVFGTFVFLSAIIDKCHLRVIERAKINAVAGGLLLKVPLSDF